MSEPTEAERVQRALIDVVSRAGADAGSDGSSLRTLLGAALAAGGPTTGTDQYVEALVATADMQLSKAMSRGLASADAVKGLEGTGMAASVATWVVGAWSSALAAPPAVAETAPILEPAPRVAAASSTPIAEPVVVEPDPAVPPLRESTAMSAMSAMSEVAPIPETAPTPESSGPEFSGTDSSGTDPSGTKSFVPVVPEPIALDGNVEGDLDKLERDLDPATRRVAPEPATPEPPVQPKAERLVVNASRPTPGIPSGPSTEPNVSNKAPVDAKSRPGWLLPVGVAAIVALAVGAFVVTRSGDDGLKSRTLPVETIKTSDSTVATTVAAAESSAVAADSAAPDSVAPDSASAETTAATVATKPVASSSGGRVSSAEMVAIPAGSYPVGSEKPDLLAESTRRTIDMPAYFIDLHEVTNAQYKAFVDKTAAAPPLAGWTKQGPPDDQLDHPVRAVTFEWATAYCSSLGKRLPTEAEWEVAAGGKDGKKFAWGNDLAAVQLPANGSYAVMSVAANKSSMGVFDLTGSVWEWVSDPYDANKVGSGKHVLRGGQNGYVRNNWSRLPVDETASNAVLAAGVRCAATEASTDVAAGAFGDYTRPADPVAPAVTVPAGFKSFDDFSGAKLEWVEINKPNARFGYHPNKFFHLETKEKSTNIVALCPCVTPGAPIAVVATGEVESTLTQPDGTFEWGIVIRSDESTSPPDAPTNYVALVVDPRNHRWRAYIHRPDGSVVDIGRAQFNSDESENITLELRDLGTKIEYYINDTYRGESPPGAVLPSGNHAGFVLTSDAASTKVHIHYGSFGIRSVS